MKKWMSGVTSKLVECKNTLHVISRTGLNQWRKWIKKAGFISGSGAGWEGQNQISHIFDSPPQSWYSDAILGYGYWCFYTIFRVGVMVSEGKKIIMWIKEKQAGALTVYLTPSSGKCIAQLQYNFRVKKDQDLKCWRFHTICGVISHLYLTYLTNTTVVFAYVFNIDKECCNTASDAEYESICFRSVQGHCDAQISHITVLTVKIYTM